MLTINFSKVRASQEPLVHLDKELLIRDEFLKRSHKLLFEAKNIHVTGDLFYEEPFVTGNFQVEADLVVPSSRSLKPVSYHQKFTFTENYSQEPATKDQLEEFADPIVLVKDDLIDLQTAVEDNILLNIPTTILTPEEKQDDQYPAGNDWQVISEKKFAEEKKDTINPAFAKLKILFDSKNDDDSSSK